MWKLILLLPLNMLAAGLNTVPLGPTQYGPLNNLNASNIVANSITLTGTGYNTFGTLIIGTNGISFPSNTVPLGQATLVLDRNVPQLTIITNASFAISGINNLTGSGVIDHGDIFVSNSLGSTITATAGGGWVVDRPNGVNTSSSTWGLTNGSGFSHAQWWSMQGSFSNIIFYGKQ